MAIEFNPVTWFQSLANAFSSVQKKIKEGQTPESLKHIINKALADQTAAQKNELRNKTFKYEPLEGVAIGSEVSTEDQIDAQLKKLDSSISQLKKERFSNALFSILSVFSKPRLIHTWNAEMSQVSQIIPEAKQIPDLQKALTDTQYTILKSAAVSKTGTAIFTLLTKNDSYNIEMDEGRGVVSLQKGAEPTKEFTSYPDMLQSLKLNGKPEFAKVFI